MRYLQVDVDVCFNFLFSLHLCENSVGEMGLNHYGEDRLLTDVMYAWGDGQSS